jgi:hypothetical protein
VRNTGKIFEFINDIKIFFNNINLFISIYSNADTGIEDIKFPEKYKMSAECADREIITNIKNFARPQSPNKRRKLIRSKKLNILKVNLRNDLETIRINYN